MTVKDLESAISRLSPAELAEFAAWFDEYETNNWDQQIASDAKSGRLDTLMQQAGAEFKAGRCRPL
jgi:hypothetical protein